MVNIANEAGSFFQTDAELKKQKEKEAKYNYTEGDCIQLSTKALGLIVLQSGKYAYVAESGFNAKRINLEASLLLIYKSMLRWRRQCADSIVY